MLSLERIRVGGSGFQLDADLALPSSARVAIIGPSGAGKSTLLEVIAGFRAPQRGRVLWQGIDLTPLAPQARPVAMLFQDQNLFPNLSLSRNIALALRPDGWRLRPDEVRQQEAVLARTGLAEVADRRPGQVSGGQRARAALARVLLQRRPVLLLDEPFAALGPALRGEMLTLVREVADEIGALVLMVTHDPRDARAFAQTCVLVAEGKVHAPVATAPFFDTPPEALRRYLGD